MFMEQREDGKVWNNFSQKIFFFSFFPFHLIQHKVEVQGEA